MRFQRFTGTDACELHGRPAGAARQERPARARTIGANLSYARGTGIRDGKWGGGLLWLQAQEELLVTPQMLSLRSLAFILCSAIRRARALSCAALDCPPHMINNMATAAPQKGRKRATNNATKMCMCSFLRTVYTSQGRSRLGEIQSSPLTKIQTDPLPELA
jgi:hypothetical protein